MINKYIKKITLSAIAFGISAFAWSCDSEKDGPKGPEKKETAQTTLLIYAVATNSLSGNLVSDKNEMLKAAEKIDLDKNNILVFETRYLNDASTGASTSKVSLLKLSKIEEEYDWETIQEFENGYPSLDPSNINGIIQYVAENYPADNKGLILWSHSTASQPYVSSRALEDLPMMYSFGQDQINKNEFNQINIDDLASSVPDNLFDYIWFDSCYMSNIETIYEFRDKCDAFIGYPTEVLEYGLPYDIVLPYLVGVKPDLKEAADLFFKYYAESSYAAMRIATIAVIDMNKIDLLADLFGEVSQELNVSSSSLMKYTRYSTGPFYDLGDYAKALLKEQLNGSSEEIPSEEIEIKTEEFNKEWDDTLNECVIYKAATQYNFAGQLIDQDRYSGISTHVYSFGTQDSDSESYYKSLGWYQTTFVK